MGFNRKPHYTRGVLLVGDAGGMVNPFNGEGIAYAMESGELAAEVVVQALARPDGRRRASGRSQAYPPRSTRRYGGYYTLGRVFVKLIGNPTVMKHGHPARPAAPDADAVHPEAAGQPHRPARRRRHRTGSSTRWPRSPRRLTA